MIDGAAENGEIDKYVLNNMGRATFNVVCNIYYTHQAHFYIIPSQHMCAKTALLWFVHIDV